MTRKLDPAIKLQRLEERLCECGAAGSGEGHENQCPAKKFDRIPKNMTAANALRRITRTPGGQTTARNVLGKGE